MDPNSTVTDPMYEKVDSLVRDGTLTPAQADNVYQRVREPGGVTSAVASDRERRRWTLPRRAAGGAAMVGAGLLLGSLLVARFLADQEDFNWKAFVVVLVGALALTAVGAVAALRGHDADHRRWVASGLIATGIAAAALALAIVLRDQDWASYLTGGLMLVAGLAAYVWLRGAALTAVIILGGLLVVGQLISDVFGDDSDSLLWPGLALTVFGLVVMGVGWRLADRRVTGILGGIIALAGMLIVILGGLILTAAASFFGRPPGASQTDVPGVGGDGDTWTALIIGLLVCALLAVMYAYSDYVGYLVLAFSGATLLVFTALFALDTENRLWFSVIVGAIGGLVVAGAVLRELLSGRGGGGRRMAHQPASGPAPDYATGQYGQPPHGQPTYGQPPYGQPPPPSQQQQQYPPQPPPPAGPPPP